MDRRKYNFFQNVQSILLELSFLHNGVGTPMCKRSLLHPHVPSTYKHVHLCSLLPSNQQHSTASSLCLPTPMNTIFCIGNFTEAILSSLNPELQHHPTERSVKRTVSTPAHKAPPPHPRTRTHDRSETDKTSRKPPPPLLHLLSSSYGGMHR